MPFTGSVDVSDIIANLGDPSHGLRPAGLKVNSEVKEDNNIYRATYRGPVEFSTNTDLAIITYPIWDVNGYYRSLGIGWPYKPTKKELRLGYQRNNGHDSERLTYYFKQLLDPEIRKQYDLTPLGNVFRDKYVIEEDARKLSDFASEMSEATGKIVTVEDLITEYEERKKLSELPAPEDQIIRWQWSYYLMNSRKYETESLELWQAYLISSFSGRKVRRKIAIGYVGKTKKPFVVKQYRNDLIFFLNEQVEPTMELAKKATASKKQRSRPMKEKR